MIQLPVVELWWRDIEITNVWEEMADMEGARPPLVRSIGMLLDKRDDALIIIMSHSDTQCNGRKVIPIGCVESIRILKEMNFEEIDVYQELPDEYRV